MKVLIYGAGSIGNHLSQAARRMEWEVTVVDINTQALIRMREDIYPKRYGSWDDNIILTSDLDEVIEGYYDLIMVGTPPDYHYKLALEALKYKPRLLHVEKPLFKPDDDIKAFEQIVNDSDSMVTVGYDHAVAPSFQALLSYISTGEFGDVMTIDGATREHWEGIFKAHPWLAGPHDSYLGYTLRGGGAACEHSHALHLVLTVADVAKWGDVQGSCDLDMVTGNNGEHYDQAAFFTLRSSSGKVARVVQDVLTKPTEKYVRVQCEKAVLLWRCESGADVLEINSYAGEQIVRRFSKTRPDDFYYLMRHYQALLNGEISITDSALRVDTGLRVMSMIKSGL